MSIKIFNRFFQYLLSVVTAFIAIACRPDIPPHPYQDEELLRREVQAKRVFLIDSRIEEEFAGVHIPGAVNIPHTKMKENITRVPKDVDIVLYCGIGVRSQKALNLTRLRRGLFSVLPQPIFSLQH